jgi:hypothetical protein
MKQAQHIFMAGSEFDRTSFAFKCGLNYKLCSVDGAGMNDPRDAPSKVNAPPECVQHRCLVKNACVCFGGDWQFQVTYSLPAASHPSNAHLAEDPRRSQVDRDFEFLLCGGQLGDNLKTRRATRRD